MKKKMFILVLGLLIIGANAYAAGDLQVNGNLGVGTTPANAYKAKIISTNQRASQIQGIMDQNGAVAADIMQGLSLKAEMTGTASGDAQGINLISVVSTNAAEVSSASGANFVVALASSTGGSTTVTQTSAGLFDTLINPGNHNYAVTDGYGFNLILRDNRTSGTGTLSFTNYKGVNINNADNAHGALSVGTLSGIWIDKQTLGSVKNYGIVLNGNGAGADIVFGTGQNASIYSATETSGNLASTGIWVKDSSGNATQISPHDPATGEWIYYSKNTKTGVVKRVNMEKLVKAVEKLTGEKFMIETIEEIK